ncbi:MAG TPA: PIN domain-containing protein [Candidatus Angelobacter sp.]|jgi:predicted nucleic acid-binding protein|nr:PIN domain-containing protein [Candidatus Angelobacter sp.]
MDRLFLDANVIFSAAYRPHAGLLDLWKLKTATLCTSPYALEEARINLSEEIQRERLKKLSMKLDFFDAAIQKLPPGISLPDKDIPIMLAAIEAQATHLLTGDLKHFGAYFGKRISDILIISPGEYLRAQLHPVRSRD